MKHAVIIETSRDSYSASDVSTLTVGELINELMCYDSNTPVVLSFDKGYTFGGLSSRRIKSIEDTSYGEEEEEEDEE